MKEVRIESRLVNNGHYVPGMISGGMLYVSGQLPVHLAPSCRPVTDGFST